MRKLLLIVWFLMMANSLIAQDTLYKENGSKLIVKIIEINATQVKYKVLINPDDLIYVIDKDEVKKIVHENGLVDIFPKSNFYLSRPVDRFDSDYKRSRDKYIPKKFSNKYYYINIIETNFLLSKAYYEDGFLAKGGYKYSIGLHVINGMRFCKNHFLGLGFGFNTSNISHHHAKGTLTGIPFFVDYRYYLLKVKPQLYGNMTTGVFKSGNLFHFQDVYYLPYINPSLGISFRVSQSVSGNFSMGYTIYIHKATLYTIGNYYAPYYSPYYTPPSYYHSTSAYSYHQHKVWNNKNCFNIKFGFVF